MVRFGKRGKISSRFIRPFEILERVSTVVYRLALPPSMSGVHEVFHVSMLQRYTPDPTHVVDWGEIEVNTDGTFKEGPVCNVDSCRPPIIPLNTCIYPMGVTLTHRSHITPLGPF